MNETDVKELLQSAVPPAPQARFDMERAVRSGTRRQRSRVAATAAVGVSLAAVLGGSLLTLTGGPQQTQLATGGNASATASASPSPMVATQSPSATPSKSPTLAQLEALATQVAEPAGGTAKITTRDETTLPSGAVTRSLSLGVVVPGEGAFDVRVSSDADLGNGVSQWAESCAIDDKSNERNCRALITENGTGVWAWEYAQPRDKRVLRLATTLASGDTLTITVDNYTEAGAGGQKTVGPSWDAVGITAASINAAAQALRS